MSRRQLAGIARAKGSIAPPDPIQIMMKTMNSGVAEQGTGRINSTIRSRIKGTALAVLLSGVAFVATGCYDDPYYGHHRGVRTGYYASYGTPAPYYGYDPYSYGYGPGIAVGVSSYRSYPRYTRNRYYGRGDYRYRSGYQRYSGRRYDGRRYDGRRYDGRRYDRRNWDRRRSDDRDRTSRRRSTSERTRVIRRSVAPDQEEGAPVARQPE